MNCPKCGKQIADNSLRCEHCGVKVRMVCPHCHSLNKFGAKECVNCSAVLIVKCVSCGAINLATATNCRKCGTLLGKLNNEVEIKETIPSGRQSVQLENSENIEPKTVEKKTTQEQKTFVVPMQETVAEVQEENEFEIVESQEDVDDSYSQLDLFSGVDVEIVEESVKESVPDTKNEEHKETKPVGELLTSDLMESVSVDNVLQELEAPVKIDAKSENINSEVQNNIVEPTIEQENPKTEVESIQQTEDISSGSNSQQSVDEQKPIEIVYYSQIQAKQKIISTIKNSKIKQIIAVNGEEGSGKSIVLQYVMNELSQNNILSLLGECTPLTQISNYGFIQDLFLRYLSLPAFVANIELFLKNNKKIFENVFDKMTSEEVMEFINFLYPHKKGQYEDILNNKDKFYSILEKAFISILNKNKVVIVADDFDLIDSSSYDFLINLIEKDFFEHDVKLLISYKEKKVAQSYFYSNALDENSFENIYLDRLSQEQIETFVSNFVNGDLSTIPAEVFEIICVNSRGNASYIEQTMAFLHDKGILYFENENVKYQPPGENNFIPATTTDIVKQRLESTSKMTPTLKNVLFVAATMGYKFDIQLLSGVLSLTNEQVGSALQQLSSLLYIIQISPYTYEFKSLSLWRNIFEIAKQSDLYPENNRRLYGVIENCVLSNSSMKAIVAQGLSSPSTLFAGWREVSDLLAYVGDVNLFVIAQKQCLKILSENNFENSQVLYNEICEKIGKLIYKTNPAEAIEYLSNVIASAKKIQDNNKIIDLCGFVITSCYEIGNFYGVIEAVDMVLNIVQGKGSELQLALIKSRKIKALFNIGNCDEVINLINLEILSILEAELAKPTVTDTDDLTMIYETWLATSLTLADAYSLQGNSKGFEIIDNVLEIMQINKLESRYYQTKAALTKAFSNTIAGKIKASYDILNEITDLYKADVLEPEFLCQWNLIHVLNQLLAHNFDNLKEELFSLATFANNTNDQFTKNILKTILGYIIQNDSNYAKALDIYNEQITYFAKEKIATGALLCWYLIAQITLTVEGADKALDIASKALEVAKNPRINNYNFIVYLQKFIAEIFIIKGDLDATKMYIEKALLISRQYGMKYAQVELYLAYAKYLQEVISVKVVNKSENAQQALKMFSLAEDIATELDLENLIAEVNKDKSSFKTYCQLNSIDIL